MKYLSLKQNVRRLITEETIFCLYQLKIRFIACERANRPSHLRG